MSNSNIEKKLTKFVWFIMICVIGLLTILSIFKTSFIAEKETVTFVNGHWYIHAAAIVLLTAVLGLSGKTSEAMAEKLPGVRHRFHVNDGIFWTVIVAVNVALSVGWILATRLYPVADQEFLLKIADDMQNGVYKEWQPGGYMFLYPFQNGILLPVYAISCIFHEDTYLAAQFINVPFYILGIIATSMCCLKLFKSKKVMRITAVLMTIWVPFAMYNTFIYGTMAGYALMMSAYWITLSYFEKRSFWKIPAASVAAALAVILKSNYSIMLIALIILILIDIIRKFNLKSVLFVVMLVVTLAAGKWCCNSITEHITGTNTPEGVPKIAWAAMGISGDEYGWWDGYNIYVYGANKYDYVQTEKSSMERIAQRVKHFLSNPRYCASFFGRKIVSEWCEPTFQSVSIQNSRESDIEMSGFVRSFMSDDGSVSRAYRFILDIFQTHIYMGALLWLWRGRKDITFEQLLPGICLIGGFLFHIVWEAKGQYTIVYFYLIIMYCVKGWLTMLDASEQ